MRKDDLCIFTENDMSKTTNLIDATLVRIFIDKKITYADFTKMHREYRISCGWTSSQAIISEKNNTLKPLVQLLKNNDYVKKSPITLNKFFFIIKDILKLNPYSNTMSFKDNNNVEYVVTCDKTTF
jgi:hypothetical protein